MSNNVVLLQAVHRTPSRISFGPALTAVKLGYKVSRAHWIAFGKYLKLGPTGAIKEVTEDGIVEWDPKGQFDIMADDWVILE